MITHHLSAVFFTMVTMFTCVMSSYLNQQQTAKCRFVTQFVARLVIVSCTKFNVFSFSVLMAFPPADQDSISKIKVINEVIVKYVSFPLVKRSLFFYTFH